MTETAEIEERRLAIEALETKHGVSMNRKKKRALMELSQQAFEAHKLGMAVSSAMKVT